MARKRHAEDEGIPPFDENAPERPSDDEEIPLPGDRPAMANDRVTAAEQREGETLHTRVAREEREPDLEESARGPDDAPRRTAGRLIEPTVEGRDETRELAAEESDDRLGLTAEEAAVTVHDSDEQLTDEPSTDEAAGRGADRGA